MSSTRVLLMITVIQTSYYPVNINHISRSYLIQNVQHIYMYFLIWQYALKFSKPFIYYISLKQQKNYWCQQSSKLKISMSRAFVPYWSCLHSLRFGHKVGRRRGACVAQTRNDRHYCTGWRWSSHWCAQFALGHHLRESKSIRCQ